MNPAMELRNEKLAQKVVAALKRRHFEACAVKTREEALAKALEWIPKGDVVSWGGSMTTRDIGLIDALRAGGYRPLDRDAVPQAERQAVMRQALLADSYVTSVNAISEDGQLVCVDGAGNRVAAMTYGPRNVVVVAGINKVVKSADDAMTRARTVAAPINAQRFGGHTGCAVTGACENCMSDDCICNVLVTFRRCRPNGRIKVILVQQDLGF